MLIAQSKIMQPDPCKRDCECNPRGELLFLANEEQGNEPLPQDQRKEIWMELLTERSTPGHARHEDKPGELTAFCASRPEPEKVAQLLRSLGFRLVFEMAEDRTCAATRRRLPPLPAQYHFEDAIGTGVIYLAGPDFISLADDEDEADEVSENEDDLVRSRYPAHASRFWLIAGGRELVSRRVRDVLAKHWDLTWQDLRAVEAGAAVAQASEAA